VRSPEIPESLKNKKNNSLSSASKEMPPPSYSSCCDSRQFQTEDRVSIFHDQNVVCFFIK